MDAVEVIVARKYFPDQKNIEIEHLGNGLINRTFTILCRDQKGADKRYVLQEINEHVFKHPQHLFKNFELISAQLSETNYPYQQLKLLTCDQQKFLFHNNKFWRVFEFIDHDPFALSCTKDCSTIFKLAEAYATFIKSLWNLNPNDLLPVIDGFHNVQQYFFQFENALQSAMLSRKIPAKNAINFIKLNTWVLQEFEGKQLPKRVVHADPKLSNILMNSNGNEVEAVIDWDTVMSGFLMADYGDIIRSSANSVEENHKTIEEVSLVYENFEVISKAFVGTLKDCMNKAERESLVFGAIFICYEQSIRFLSDFLNNDIYYQTTYELQNLDRANNQIALLKSILSQREKMEGYIESL